MKNGRRLISPLIPSSFKNLHISRPYSSTTDHLSSALQHYIQSDFPLQGQKIHAHILKIGFQPNTNISIKLLILHLRCGCLNYARYVFDQMPKPTVSSYNSLIGGYLKHGQVEKSLNLIQRLVFSDERPDGFTFSMILKVSTTTAMFTPKDLGKQVHAQILKANIETDDVLFTALVDSYSKNGKVDYARKVFDKMFERNVVCSTAMISGYMKQGSVRNAEEIFEKTIDKDIVVFNAMIEGYSKSLETARKSLEVYIEMQRLGFRPTISTFVSVIGACSMLSTFEVGQQIQNQLMKTKLFEDVKLGSALLDMYSKCGRVDDARNIFDYMPEKNVFSWTSMIDGYGKNGHPNESLHLFKKMQCEHRIKPNYVTFLGALSACGHAGLVAEGWKIFKSMERDYLLKPRMEHYSCMVDLLGRSGNLNEALEFIFRMPEKPDSDVWAALLGASRLHDDVKMAGFAANEIFKLRNKDGRRPGAYVALSNTFAAAGKWEGVSEVRELMKDRGVSKDTGRSWAGAYVALSNTFAAAGKWEGVSEVRELMKDRGVSKDTGRSWVGTDNGLCGFHVGQKFEIAEG